MVSSDFGLRGSLAVRQNRGEGMDGDRVFAATGDGS